MNKRGQMELSFGMIFSIILIIAFLVFAFFAIQKFMDFQKEIKYKQFEEALQNDIDTIWESSTNIEKPVTYFAPRGLDAICFEDGEFEDLSYRSKELRSGLELNHFDNEKTLGSKSQLCIKVIEGKISFKLNKNFGNPLVSVSEI